MRILILITLLTSVSGALAEVTFDPPEGWILEEAKASSPGTDPGAGVTAMKYHAPDGSLQVTVAESAPIRSVPAMDESIAGAIRGMKNGGYLQERLENCEVLGLPATHLVGEFRSEDYEGAYYADTYLIPTEEALVMISVVVDDAAGGRELGDGILDRIGGLSGPVELSEHRAEREVSVAESIGYYGFFAVLGLGLFSMVRRGAAKRRASSDS